MTIKEFVKGAPTFWGLFSGWFGKAKAKIPDVVKPKEEAKGCGCDLTLPPACPLASHGDEATVDAWLAAGGAPEVGGMPAAIRYQLLRPSGKSWSYAPMASSGLIRYDSKTDTITVNCGVFEGQRYHPVFKSAHDQGLHMPGTKIEPGKVYPFNGENFVYFQCYQIK